MATNKKIILIIVVVALLAGIFLYMNPAATSISLTTPCDYENYPIVKLNTPLPSPRQIPTDGLSLYRSEQFRFSLFYPTDLKVKEYPEIGAAETIVFQDPNSLAGFQVFIVPYVNPGIVPRRIAKDVPTGVAYDRATTTVSGVCATTFTTHGVVAPDTSEVWVPYRGYLYEITTYAEQKDKLGSIVDSWRFL